MGMYATLGISATGLTAQRLRMDVIASNLANADSTTAVGEAYRRRTVALAPASGGSGFSLPAAAGAGDGGAAKGVTVSGIVEDTSPLRRTFEPGHPLADPQGYVTRPNVNAVTEMVDLMAATRSFQANVSAFEATKAMARDGMRLIQ